MSEGPTNFGKPLAILVLLGCIGGGFYLYKTWPTSFEGNGWQIKWPHAWEANSVTDPDLPLPKCVAKGELPDEGPIGFGTVSLHIHGALDWPNFVFAQLAISPDWQEDLEIDYKKSVMFTFDDQTNRYLAAGVQRGDVVVIARIGCPKADFDKYRPLFEKVIKSVRCQR